LFVNHEDSTAVHPRQRGPRFSVSQPCESARKSLVDTTERG